MQIEGGTICDDADDIDHLSLTISKGDRRVFSMKGVGRSAVIMNEDDLPKVVNLLGDALNEARMLVVKSGRKGYHDVDEFYRE